MNGLVTLLLEVCADLLLGIGILLLAVAGCLRIKCETGWHSQMNLKTVDGYFKSANVCFRIAIACALVGLAMFGLFAK